MRAEELLTGRHRTTAQGFFHWGVVTDPKSSRAMTNYALAQQIVKQDYDKAEKLYHMALTIDKNDRSAHTNLDELLLNRLPGGLYVSPAPGWTSTAARHTPCASWCA